MKDHKELDVWKSGIELVMQVYEETRAFPKEELFGLSSQARRAAVSIPSNIAEGAARYSAKEFLQYLHISLGSVSELETQLIIAERLGYLRDAPGLQQRLQSVKQMLNGLIRHYRKRERTGSA